MSILPPDTEKIVGQWKIVNGKKLKDENWLLIERYIADESRLVARDAHAYMCVEFGEKRAWQLTYADSLDKKAGPPTLLRFLPKTDDQNEKGRALHLKALGRWQKQYLRYLADPACEPDWPQWRTVFAKLVCDTAVLREFWTQNKHECDPAFNALIEEIITGDPEASDDR